MAIKARIDWNIEKQRDNIVKRVINAFIRAGEEFITDGREQIQDHAAGTYVDITANLRNSIGYYVFYNGEKVIGSPVGDYAGPKIEGALSPAEIEENCMNAIREHVLPQGIQLIGVAGMNYASYVESKGYNVISYQMDVCFVNLATYLEHLDVLPEGTAARIEETFV